MPSASGPNECGAAFGTTLSNATATIEGDIDRRGLQARHRDGEGKHDMHGIILLPELSLPVGATRKRQQVEAGSTTQTDGARRGASGREVMVKQFLAMIALSLLAACAIAHRTPTMTARWDTTTVKHDTTVKQLGGKP